jgi:hypothetical protein
MAILLSTELTAMSVSGGAPTARAYVTAPRECLVFIVTIHCNDACRVACGHAFFYFTGIYGHSEPP